MEKARYRITKSTFIKSAVKIDHLLLSDKPEVAFIGRSNVGKSTLLNALCVKKSLARTSKTPGRTQAFNYFEIEFLSIPKEGDTTFIAKKVTANFVDLPGYGFAEVPKHISAKWPQLIEQYLLKRQQLNGLLLLMDCRRDPGEEERWLAEMGRGGNFRLVLTKLDKVSKNEFESRKRSIKKELRLGDEQIVGVSAEGKSKLGIDELRDVVCSWLVNAE